MLFIFAQNSQQTEKEERKKIVRHIYTCSIHTTQFNIVCLLIESENQVEEERENGKNMSEWSDFGFGFSKPFFIFICCILHNVSLVLRKERKKQKKKKKGESGRKYMNKHTRTAVRTNKQICWIYVVYIGKCLCAPANPKRIWSVAFANDYLLENINSIFKWIPTMCLRIHITFYSIYYYGLFVRCQTIVVRNIRSCGNSKHSSSSISSAHRVNNTLLIYLNCYTNI